MRSPSARSVRAGGDVVANRPAHEAGDTRGRGDEHPLFPHFLPNVVGEARVEAGVEQRCGDGLDPWRTRAVEFAEAQRMPIIEMDDGAVGVEGRGDCALPTEHALWPEAFGKPVDVAHAIQQRQNRRRWADRVSERHHRALEVKGFAAQHHEVERFREIFFQNNGRRSAVDVADRAMNDQSVLRKLGRTPRTNEKRHVAACLQQTSAEIAADCARSDNKNSHVTRFLNKERGRRPVPGAAQGRLRHETSLNAAKMTRGAAPCGTVVRPAPGVRAEM